RSPPAWRRGWTDPHRPPSRRSRSYLSCRGGVSRLWAAEAVALELDELLVGAEAPRFLVVDAVQPVGQGGLGLEQVQALVGSRPLGRHAARLADHPPQLARPDELAVARAGGGRDALVDQGAAE